MVEDDEMKNSLETDKFTIYFWKKDYDEMPKGFKKRMWCGKIVHNPTQDTLMFNQVSEMLKFMEDHRIE